MIQHRTAGIDKAKMIEGIRELISEGRSVQIRVRGYSMNPFLMHMRDSITLSPWKEEDIRKGTVALVKDIRGEYLIHRIIAVRDDHIILLGDGNIRIYEKAYKENIIAVATGFTRNGKDVSTNSFRWKAYSFLWNLLRPVRRWPLGLWRRLNPQASLK